MSKNLVQYIPCFFTLSQKTIFELLPNCVSINHLIASGDWRLDIQFCIGKRGVEITSSLSEEKVERRKNCV